MKTALLVDGNTFIWRAAYALSHSPESIAKKVLFYFCDLMNKFKPDDFVVCWDEGQSIWRSKIFVEYKAPRLEKHKKSDLDLAKVKEQSGYVWRYLNSLGIVQVKIPGVEADDVLAWLTEYYVDVVGNYNVIISTSDKDLWQLIREDKTIEIYDHQKETRVDWHSVFGAFGINPPKISELKALMGDASDNLAGIKGIGEKTGALLLKDYTIGDLVSADKEILKDLTKKKATSKILDDGELLAEMYRLVKLPELKEAFHYLSKDEIKLLREQLKFPQKEEFRSRILSERVETSIQSSERLVPVAPVEIGGMVDYMENCGGLERSWGSLEDLDRAILGCGRCVLRGDCKEYGPTLPKGYSNCEIMLVGRNPGEQELVNGVPFFPDAPAGAKLNEFLAFVELTRDECWVTNAVKCYSQDNRPPTYGEIVACSAFLRAEIDFLKPKLIITFGNEAMMLLTPYKSRVTKHCGEILENPVGLIGQVAAKVAVCVHPSAACRSSSGEHDFHYAATQVKTLLDKVTKK